MFAVRTSLGSISSRLYMSTKSSMSTKVAVLGAAGGIGQPLSLLFKLSPYVDELACYDIVATPGVAADLSHIPTRCRVTGHLPSAASWPPRSNQGLKEALTGATMVVIPAGIPRKPGMTRDDLFNTNAGIVEGLIEGCAEFCPNAFLAIISNPVNSMVPIAAEVLKKRGVYNPRKLCGVTVLDVVRAQEFIAEHLGTASSEVDVKVIGGHAGITILPLLSQVKGLKLTDEERERLTVRTQFGGEEVVVAKAGAGSATLSMAYAGFHFAEEVLKAMTGKHEVIQCAYVESDLTAAPFFATPCKFGLDGVEEVLPYGELTPYEQQWFDKMMPELQAQIQKGVDFVHKK